MSGPGGGSGSPGSSSASSRTWPTVRLSRRTYTVRRRFILQRSALVVGERLKHSGIKDPSDPSDLQWALIVMINDSPWTNDDDARAFFKLRPMKEAHEIRAEATVILEEIYDNKAKVTFKEHYPLRLLQNEGFEKLFSDGIALRPTLQKLVISVHLLYVGNELMMDHSNLHSQVQSRMGKDLLDLFDSSKHSDVVFEISGKEIRAHKQILAAFSSVFSAMFEHESKEQRTGRVVISDCKEPTFREMLRCLYSGKEPNWISDEFTLDLLFVADKYCLESLKAQCSERMLETLNVNNVTAMLQAVQVLNIAAANEIVFEYFKDYAKQVVKTKSWHELESTNPTLAAKFLKTTFS